MTDIAALESYAGLLSEAAQRSIAVAEKQEKYIHGGPTEDVITESGPVPTLAKQVVLAEERVSEAVAEVATQMAGAMTYGSTALGILGTSSDGYFSVPSPDSREYLILYKNDSGIATEIKRYPSEGYVTSLLNNQVKYSADLIRTQTIIVQNLAFA
ncbi:hypothetical protein [Pseudomonas helleri]|uniref:hypothetical protein n=1 Tax=Pseudomonas helleri TaxID=1608996 RepID=UPI003FD20F76